MADIKRLSLRIAALWSIAFTCAASSVTLTPSSPSPQPVGTPIVWTGTVDSLEAGLIDYQFSVAPPGAAYKIARDFAKSNSFVWTPAESEGNYKIRVIARYIWNRQELTVEAEYSITPRSIAVPVVGSTNNPLVMLYSAPPCSGPSVMRVRFWSAAESSAHWTPAKVCDGLASVNFYVAGLHPETTYSIQPLIEPQNGTASFGVPSTFKTGSVSIRLPKFTLKSNQQGSLSVGNETILWGFLGSSGANAAPLLATDLSGGLVWYYNETQPVLLCRTTPAGSLLLLVAMDSSAAFTILREIDVAGNTLRETTSTRLSEQLVARGEQPIYYFSHEAIRLPGDFTAVLGTIARQEPGGVQGPGSKLVEGDAIVVLDANFQVVWSWNAFAHLDVARAAVDEDAGPLYPNGPLANDWTHANSIEYLPSDGNLLLSMRSQDWVVKLDYRDGKGSGGVLWRLGKDGDFSIASSDPWPWFSHQHDANSELVGNGLFSVFDNGNTRRALNPNAHSRGQVLQLDEVGRKAALLLNADLGVYSQALGTAQHLINGNHSFLAGLVTPDDRSELVEVDPKGDEVYRISADLPCYRAIRLPDMYGLLKQK